MDALSGHTTSHSGSIDGLGVRFQSFGINDLELVDQNSASRNHVSLWLRQVAALRQVA
jgi:hypothetical protein